MRTMTAPAHLGSFIDRNLDSNNTEKNAAETKPDASTADATVAEPSVMSPVPKRRRPGFGEGLARLQSADKSVLATAEGTTANMRRTGSMETSAKTTTTTDTKKEDGAKSPAPIKAAEEEDATTRTDSMRAPSPSLHALAAADTPRSVDTQQVQQQSTFAFSDPKKDRGLTRSISAPTSSSPHMDGRVPNRDAAPNLTTSVSFSRPQDVKLAPAAAEAKGAAATTGFFAGYDKELITPATKRIIETATQDNERLAALKVEILEELQGVDEEIAAAEAALLEVESDTTEVEDETQALKTLQEEMARIESLLEVQVSELNNALPNLPESSFVAKKLKEVSAIGIPLGSLGNKDRLKNLIRLDGKIRARLQSGGGPSSTPTTHKFPIHVQNMLDDKNRLIDHPGSQKDMLSREQHLFSIYQTNLTKAQRANADLSKLELSLAHVEKCGSPYVDGMLEAARKNRSDNVRPELPLYECPAELQCFHDNVKAHAEVGHRIQEILKKRAEAENERKRELAVTYMKHRRTWVLRLEGKYEKPEKGSGKQDHGGGSSRGLKPERTPMRSSSRLRPNMSGIVRSEYELNEAINRLAAVERMKTLVKIPDMLSEEEKRAIRFPSKNGLRRDPVADLQADRDLRPWTQEERDIFIEKYMEFPKQFRQIASFLEHRTTGDCIKYYYRFQKLKELDPIRKTRSRQKMKKMLNEAKRTAAPFMGGSQPILPNLANLAAPPPPRRAAEAATIANRQTIMTSAQKTQQKQVAKKKDKDGTRANAEKKENGNYDDKVKPKTPRAKQEQDHFEQAASLPPPPPEQQQQQSAPRALSPAPVAVVALPPEAPKKMDVDTTAMEPVVVGVQSIDDVPKLSTAPTQLSAPDAAPVASPPTTVPPASTAGATGAAE